MRHQLHERKEPLGPRVGRGDWGELCRGNGCMAITGAFIPATPSCGVDGKPYKEHFSLKRVEQKEERRRGGREEEQQGGEHLLERSISPPSLP